MTVITTWTCDRCAKTDTKADNHSHVSIGCRSALSPYGKPNIAREALWCEDCVKALKVYIPNKPAPDALPPPTLEDLIREIAAEAAIDAVRDR